MYDDEAETFNMIRPICNFNQEQIDRTSQLVLLKSYSNGSSD